jgi:CBS domain containing-hemolysin-like protein
MPDTDAPSRSDSNSAPERINLPVPVPQPVPQRESGESWITRVLRAVFGWKETSARADLQTVLNDGAHDETGFSLQERTMLTNILALRGRRVDDVMVPRADIIAVQQEISLGELIKVFEGAGHSRLVVYNETLDDPVGMVHIRDVIGYMVRHAAVSASVTAKRKKPLTAGLDLKKVDLSVSLQVGKIIREVLFVPPSMPAIDLLAKMQATRIHLALVIDEYGGTDGIVSMEDVVEQIVGDIEDEHDVAEAAYISIEPKLGLVASARTPVKQLEEHLGMKLLRPDEEEDIDTLGGLMFALLGRVPVRGELVRHPSGLELEVLDADARRLKKVRIHQPRSAALAPTPTPTPTEAGKV